MSLAQKRINEITEEDIISLITSKKREGKDIDYKLKLISNSDGDKKEFLYDISSFANSSGGHLIIGMAEQEGLPIDLVGLRIEDVDAEILRLDSLIRDGIEPRIPGVLIQPVALNSKGVAIVIRIPRSWVLPHMVSYQKATKFYSRNSAGKYPLDVSEIRSLFSVSQNISEKIKNFRMERVAQILAGDTPLSLVETPKLIIHLVPLSSLDTSLNYDVANFSKYSSKLGPLYASGWDYRFNFDGFLTYSTSRQNEVGSYLQIRRTGVIEAVNLSILKQRDNEKVIPSIVLEREIVEGVSRFLLIQKDILRIESPVVVQISLLGVRGYIMSDSLRQHEVCPIEKDILLLPDVLFENYDQVIEKILRPVFDAIWNATGWPGSINYDEEGNWLLR